MKMNNKTYRLAVGIAVGTALMLIWVNAAVGIIGDGDLDGPNAIYFMVILIGLIYAGVIHFNPNRLSRVLFTMAFAQFCVPVVAIFIWKPSAISWAPGVLQVFGLNSIFVILFFISGLLFKLAVQNKRIKRFKIMSENSKEIMVEVVVNAPVEKVWRFFTEPKHIINWNNASADWHTPKAENDLRVNGKFNYRMEAKHGSTGFDFGGTYDEVLPQKIIAYTMGDGRKVHITFNEGTGTTHIIEKFEPEKMNSIESQKSGWQAILDNFKKYTEEKLRAKQG